MKNVFCSWYYELHQRVRIYQTLDKKNVFGFFTGVKKQYLSDEKSFKIFLNRDQKVYL